MPFPQIHSALSRALADKGYAEPTAVQAAVLEAETAERDLLVSAQTGSGKTVAYGLALASTLLGNDDAFGQAAAPLALVIAPTRELAMQVQREIEWLYAGAGARVISCIGGMDPRREARQLESGCHIVVGTPGRLRDHLERRRLDATALRAVVLDEADEMLDLGFREDLEFILEATPQDRRTLLFSATIPRDIAVLARRFQRDALRIDTIDKSEPHADIEYKAMRIAPNEIELAVVNVLRFFESRGALIFCQTRDAVRRLAANLFERGFSVVALSGELSQNERTNALQSLRDGRARVCVATDVAARGIDLEHLDLVVHAELPNDAETLLHRSGRTGRAGRKGVCVLLIPYTRRRKAESLIGQARIDVQWSNPPSADDIRVADQGRIKNDPVFDEPTAEEDAPLVRMLMDSRTPEEIAGALVRSFRARLPAAEDLSANQERVVRPDRVRSENREPTERRSREPFAPAEERVRQARPDGPMVWFRMNVGRNNNADPKWILPVICRLGRVTKAEIGAIKIFDRETKFEIIESAAAKFAASVRVHSDEENVHIQPAAGAIQEIRKYAPKTDAQKRSEFRGGDELKPRGERRERFRKDAPEPSRSAPPAREAAPRHSEQKATDERKPYGDRKKSFKKDFTNDRPAAASAPPPRADAKPFKKKHRGAAPAPAPRGDGGGRTLKRR